MELLYKVIHFNNFSILYSIDIMPYSTEDKAPIQHDLFDRFLQLKDGAEEGGMFKKELA